MSMIITVDGVGDVEVDDAFANLSPEDQQKTVNEISNSKNNIKTPYDEDADYDFIGQTIGGLGGGAGGLAAGLAFAPATFGLSIPVLTALGAAVGGGTGEYLEQLWDNWSNDDKENWTKLSNDQRNEVVKAGIEEGIFGAIPGVGTYLGKGYKAVRAARGVKSALDKVGGWISGVIAAAIPGGGLAKASITAAAKVMDTGFGSKITEGLSLLSPAQREAALGPLFEVINKSLPDAIPASTVFGGPKTKAISGMKQVFGKEVNRDMMLSGYGKEGLDDLFTQLRKTDFGDEAIVKWLESDVGKELMTKVGIHEIWKQALKTAAAAEGGKTVYEAATYNKGGKVDLGDKISKLKNEGYGTKQAVAIAYSMKRRGEI